jgi:hypothetical protein
MDGEGEGSNEGTYKASLSLRPSGLSDPLEMQETVSETGNES